MENDFNEDKVGKFCVDITAAHRRPIRRETGMSVAHASGMSEKKAQPLGGKVICIDSSPEVSAEKCKFPARLAASPSPKRDEKFPPSLSTLLIEL
jgi:hypothetical protein